MSPYQDQVRVLQPPSSPQLPQKTCYRDSAKSHRWGRERGQTLGPLGLLPAPPGPFPSSQPFSSLVHPRHVPASPVADATGSLPLGCHLAPTPFMLPGLSPHGSLCRQVLPPCAPPPPLLIGQPSTSISENSTSYMGSNLWSAHSPNCRPTHLPYPGGCRRQPTPSFQTGSRCTFWAAGTPPLICGMDSALCLGSPSLSDYRPLPPHSPTRFPSFHCPSAPSPLLSPPWAERYSLRTGISCPILLWRSQRSLGG